MRGIRYTAQFKRDFKNAKKQHKDIERLLWVLEELACERPLPASMHDHALGGSYKDHRECHVNPDWLLIYRYKDNAMILVAVRTGSHGELFQK